MNGKRFLPILLIILALLLGTAPATAGHNGPQDPEGPYGTALTYQGQLQDANGPVNGTCDLRFTLWDARSGGLQVGNTLLFEGVVVSDGLFTARLDFGASAHDGGARWLQIAVRFPAGSGSYVTLTPRQELTAAPAALSLALPFQAEANTGGPLLWIENDGDGEAAGFESVGGIALWVEAPASEGVHVATAGQDGVHVITAGGRGVAVETAGGDGLFVNSAHGNGVGVNSADSNGVFVNSAGGSGLAVDSAGSDGLFVGLAGDNGVYVGSVGSPSTTVPRGENNGFAVGGAEGNGLYVGRADASGVLIDSTYSDGVAINSAGGDGYYVAQASARGLGVGVTGGDGVYVHQAGTPSSHTSSPQTNGFEVAGAEGYGLYVGRADLDGVYVNSTAWHGLNVAGAGVDGVYVGSANDDGVEVVSAGGDGVSVNRAGAPSTSIPGDLRNGFEIAGAEGNGVYVGRADQSGVFVQSAGSDGVRVFSADDDGIYVDSANDYAGVFWGSIWVYDGCVNCILSVLGLNAGDRPLEPGQIVAIQGIQASTLDNAPALWRVVPAGEGSAAVGVVRGRAELDKASAGAKVRDGRTGRRLVPREGVAQPGEYLSIVIYGPMQLRVSAASVSIQPGMRLAVGEAGVARALRTVVVEGLTLAESAPTIGIALEAADEDGFLWVLVNPQ